MNLFTKNYANIYNIGLKKRLDKIRSNLCEEIVRLNIFRLSKLLNTSNTIRLTAGNTYPRCYHKPIPSHTCAVYRMCYVFAVNVNI